MGADGVTDGDTEVPLSANPVTGSQVLVGRLFWCRQPCTGLYQFKVSKVIHAYPGCKEVLQLTDFAWSKYLLVV